MTDFEKLKTVFDELKIKYIVFIAGIDPGDPLVIELTNKKYEQISFEFDHKTEKYMGSNLAE